MKEWSPLRRAAQNSKPTVVIEEFLHGKQSDGEF